jgi:hypothetical protein
VQPMTSVDQKHLADQLRALGVDTASYDMGSVVFDEFVRQWKAQPKRPPTQSHVARALHIEQWTVLHELERLERAGRMLHPRRGVWIPVVKARKA